ncbi:SRPBCC family protein [Rufibacter roseus]|uniref:Cell division protein n=1 Tax=Rufibacter roseus TaxID=1567108 RepID=A0ABW2DNL1_9BACT|nr:SRPBCC family protein [Rufibacter roseus]
MPIINLQLEVKAPVEVCFDLSRSIDVHMLSTAKTQEKAVAGVVAGLIDLQETVTWQAVHFGVKQKLTSVITHFERPYYFVDEMVSGAFKRFKHEHKFTAVSPTTTSITESFDYTSPLGQLGKIADWLFLERYMRQLLQDRNEVIKQVAETDEWKKYLQVEKVVVNAGRV